MFAKIEAIPRVEIDVTGADLAAKRRALPLSASVNHGACSVTLIQTADLQSERVDVYVSGNAGGARAVINPYHVGDLPTGVKVSTLFNLPTNQTAAATQIALNGIGKHELHGLVYRLTALCVALAADAAAVEAVNVPPYNADAAVLLPDVGTEVYYINQVNTVGTVLTSNMQAALHAACRANCGAVARNDVQIPDFCNGIPSATLRCIGAAQVNAVAVDLTSVGQALEWLSGLVPDFEAALANALRLIASMCSMPPRDALIGAQEHLYKPLARTCLHDICGLVRKGLFSVPLDQRRNVIIDYVTTQATFMGAAIPAAAVGDVADQFLVVPVGAATFADVDADTFCRLFRTYNQRMALIDRIRLALDLGAIGAYEAGCVQHEYKRYVLGGALVASIQSSAGVSLLAGFTKTTPPVTRLYATPRDILDDVLRMAISLRALVDVVFLRAGVCTMATNGNPALFAAASKVRWMREVPASISRTMTFDAAAWFNEICDFSYYTPLGGINSAIEVHTLSFIADAAARPIYDIMAADVCLSFASLYKLVPRELFDDDHYLGDVMVARSSYDAYVQGMRAEQEHKRAVCGTAIETLQIPGVAARAVISYSHATKPYYKFVRAPVYKSYYSYFGGMRTGFCLSSTCVAVDAVLDYEFECADSLVLGRDSCAFEKGYAGAVDEQEFARVADCNITHIYRNLAPLLTPYYLLQDKTTTNVIQPGKIILDRVRHGDHSIVLRGFTMKKDDAPQGDSRA